MEAAARAEDSTTSDFLSPDTALIFLSASSEAAKAAAYSSSDFLSPDTALIFLSASFGILRPDAEYAASVAMVSSAAAASSISAASSVAKLDSIYEFIYNMNS
jgi:hypothetical protein